jgi:hypothetical protein
MSAKTVQTVKISWDGRWPRYDPRTGLWLCFGCWNNQNWAHHCTRGECGCPKKGCAGPPKLARAPVPETQIALPDPGPIFVGPKAEELRRQVEALKQS